MADTKISALTAASALDGTEVLPVVQSTTTKKTPISAILTWIQTQAVTFASTLACVGNFAVNTNKFNVAAASGNTAIAGTLGVTGASTLASLAVTGAATVGTTLGVGGVATFGATPTAYTAYGAGGRVEFTATGVDRGAGVFEVVANPPSTNTVASIGLTGLAEIKAGNAQTFNNAAADGGGLAGVCGRVIHNGSGVLSNAIALFAAPITNPGGGTITDAVGHYIAAQSVGTNNWGAYVANNASKFISTARSPIQFGNTSAYRGALNANTTIGAMMGYLSDHDGTNYIARSTSAGAFRISHAAFTVFLDASGLTTDASYTPTQRFNVNSNWGGQILVGTTAPSHVSSTAYAIGAQPTMTGTSGTIAGLGLQVVVDPAGATTANYYGSYFRVDTVAADTDALAGLYGSRLSVQHVADGNVTAMFGLDVNGLLNSGAGTVSAAYGLRVRSFTNSGAGAITTAYGLHLDAQTAGATNWGLYQAGSTTNNRFSGKLGIKMDPTNDLDVTGTFGVTGVSTFGAQINLKSYTVATLPSAATGGGMVWVSDAAGSACGALSNGTNWKRCDSMATTVT